MSAPKYYDARLAAGMCGACGKRKRRRKGDKLLVTCRVCGKSNANAAAAHRANGH